MNAKKQYNKVVLAYSGGLDTSIIIPWLKETYGVKDVIAVCGNVGQGKELDGLYEKAINTGASDAYIEDLTEEFITDYVYPTMQAGAVYERKIPARHLFLHVRSSQSVWSKIAKEVGADAICHGATGKGKTKPGAVRAYRAKALAPEIDIIAPWRIWDIKSREEEIEYAQARNIPVPVDNGENYSMDANIWHLSHEGSDLEDPWNEPKDDLYNDPAKRRKKRRISHVISLSNLKTQGIPVSIDGQKYGPVELLTAKLNELGAENGVGIDDLVENRLWASKSRGVYENPGGLILYTAYCGTRNADARQRYHALQGRRGREIRGARI